ncbi:MAG: Rpn family recombination-promoting nuclease/putative transposase [Clostridiales bacterium]|nr:Rpn family recombination-promoting nuclease/putative transposase [Clostridiales bacterium]
MEKETEEKMIAPVVTIVLYFGTDKKWNQPCSIKELLHIPKGLEDYVNDYKIHVFNIAWLTDKEIEYFESDFKIVAKFFVRKRKGLGLDAEDTQVIKHVDEVMKLLSVMTKDDIYQNLDFSKQKKGEISMCEVAQSLIDKGKRLGIQEGIQEGIQQGIQEGIQQGLDRINILYNHLIKEHREDDFDKCMADREYLNRLLKELNI